MGYLDAAYGIYKTLAASIPTAVEGALGLLTPSRVDRRIDAWSSQLVRRARVDLRVHFEAPVDWSRAYVVMSNHASLYDIPILFRVVQGSMRMVAKKELFRVPIWGRAMREAGMICVDRSDRKQAVASLGGAAQAVRQGVHVWIAPEGTRSRTGKLGPFKKGGFHLARDAGAPILPIALVGTREILPPKTFPVHRGVAVDVYVGLPVPTQGREINELMAEVRAFFLAHLPDGSATIDKADVDRSGR